MRVGVLQLRGRQPGARGRVTQVVQGVLVDLGGRMAQASAGPPGSGGEGRRRKRKQSARTFAIRARSSERTRNLTRSSSVCTTTRRKLVAGSAAADCSSTTSICARIRSSTRDISPAGHGSTSGALFSFTHARHSACRSRASAAGPAPPPTEARMSSMSMQDVAGSQTSGTEG